MRHLKAGVRFNKTFAKETDAAGGLLDESDR